MIHPATKYALDVVAGEVIAAALVRHGCRQHLDELDASADPEYPFVFDGEAADHILDFCHLCHHFEGEWAGDPFEPEPWQVFVLSSLFGWLRRSDGTRRYRKALIMVARKNGKTLLGAVIGLYCLLLDGEQGAQVINFANSLDQARILFRAAEQMRRRSSSISRKVRCVKDNLHVLETASFWRPLANDAGHLDGLHAHLGICDELHEHDGATYEVVESSMGARAQPLIVSITTAGFDSEGFGAQIYEYYRDVVDPRSGVINDEAFVYIAELDTKDDPFDESNWIKANPNLGVSVRLDYLRGEARKAQDLPRARNNFLTKHLDRWTAQKTLWLPIDDWDKCPSSIDLEALKGCRCIAGLDLSTNTDLTSMVLIFWEIDPIVVLPFFWLPEVNLRARSDNDRARYTDWHAGGLLELTPGNVIDYEFIEKRVEDLGREYRIVELAYDPFNATQTSIHLQDSGLPVVRVDQTYAQLNDACQRLEALILSHRLNHGGHSVLRWNAQNVAVKRNAHGQIRPVKDDPKRRIDGIAALVTGLARVLPQPEVKEERLVFHCPPSSRPRDYLEFDS